jgi:hypothetical protein
MTMLREARINLPVADNSGKPLDTVRDQLARALAESFGGFTLTRGRGGWINADGKLYDEPVHVFDVAAEDNADSETKLEAIADWLKVAANQEAVYVRFPSGRVQIVQ